jgi:hypothetical protein
MKNTADLPLPKGGGTSLPLVKPSELKNTADRPLPEGEEYH